MSDYRPYHIVQGELFNAIRSGLVSWNDPPSDEFIYLKTSDGRSWVKVLYGGNGLLKVIKCSESGMRRAFYIRVEVQCQLLLGDSPLKIRMVSASLTPDAIWYEMPFHALGSLEDVFFYFGGAVSEEMIEVFLLDLAASILFLHKRMIVHRDIKHENTIIRNNYRLGLADMDLSAISKLKDLMNSRKGNLLFGHPFIFGARPKTHEKGKANLDGEYTPQMADIYSLGTMILWLLGFWDEVKLVQLTVATNLCKKYFTGQTYKGTVFQDQFLTLVWESMDADDKKVWNPQLRKAFRANPFVKLALECMDCTYETTSIVKKLIAILGNLTPEKMRLFTEKMKGYDDNRTNSILIVWCNQRRVGDYYIRLAKYYKDNARVFHNKEAELIGYLTAGKLNPKLDNPLLRDVMQALNDQGRCAYAQTEPAELTMTEHNEMLRRVFQGALDQLDEDPEDMEEVKVGAVKETAAARKARKAHQVQEEMEAEAEAREARESKKAVEALEAKESKKRPAVEEAFVSKKGRR